MRIWMILTFLSLSLSYSQAQVNFSFTNTEVQEGESFCIDLTVDGFTEILSTQLRVIWDTTLLQYDTAINLGVQTNGLVFASKVDELRFTWFANDFFNGETLDSGAVLFSVCFTSLQTGESTVKIDSSQAGNPLAPEISNLADGVITNITYQEGIVISRTEEDNNTGGSNNDMGEGNTSTTDEENNDSNEGNNNNTTDEENNDSNEGDNNNTTDEDDAGSPPSGGPIETVDCQNVEVSIERTICQGDNYEGYLAVSYTHLTLPTTPYV